MVKLTERDEDDSVLIEKAGLKPKKKTTAKTKKSIQDSKKRKGGKGK